MKNLVDEVAGVLEFEGGWWRPINVHFFGDEQCIKLSFDGDVGEPLEHGQRDAFQKFWGQREQLLSDAESAICEHYLKIRDDVRERVGVDSSDEAAPTIGAINDLRRIVQLRYIYVPYAFDPMRRVVGLLADCSWDPSLGLAVRFENERIVEVGPQDIVL